MNISYDPRAMDAKRLNAERIENRSMCKPHKGHIRDPFAMWVVAVWVITLLVSIAITS